MFGVTKTTLLRRNIRFNSTSSKINNLTSKVTQTANKTVYWGKVLVELSKQVYAKEGLAPPSISEFQSVYKKIYTQALEYANAPQKALEFVKSFKLTKDQTVKYGAYGIQLFGLFALGEIVGRRQVFGYPEFGEHHHH